MCLNKITATLLTMSMLFLSTLNSCKKNSNTCADPNATNFNTDGASCVYPADVLQGAWLVKETVGGSTTTYNAAITKVDSFEVVITDTRTTPGKHNFNANTVTIDWAKKTFTIPASTLKGTIINNDSLNTEFIFGSGGSIYNVRQTYKRQ